MKLSEFYVMLRSAMTIGNIKYKVTGFVLAVICICAQPLSAQKKVSEADTGRMVWGHSDFGGYDRATMCNRTLDEVTRQYSRIYVKDTSFESIRGNTQYMPKIPSEAVETSKKCLGRLNLDQQGAEQLWAIARIYMLIGDLQKSIQFAEKAISTGVNPNEQRDLKIKALEMYLNHGAEYLGQVYYFANSIRNEQPRNDLAVFKIDYLMAYYYYVLYNPDSVLAYTNSAITLLKKMSLEDMDSIPAIEPFSFQISVASVEGDLVREDSIIEVARSIISNWRGGIGERLLANATSGLDIKRTLYNKKLKTIEGAIWENYDSVPRPLSGKPSLFVTVNHICTTVFCDSRMNAIKRIRRTFGDSLDLVLITHTVGYAHGTGPLVPQEEARVVGKFFKEFHNLPNTLIVDESPVHKIPDGRIMRDKSPLIQMLEDINGANAIVTDKMGRVQWAGALQNEFDMRAVTAVIDRALGNVK